MDLLFVYLILLTVPKKRINRFCVESLKRYGIKVLRRKYYINGNIANSSSAHNLRKKILSMIIPITGESVLQLFASFVSMAMIGRIDAVAISALGISVRVTQIIWALFKGITTGALVFVTQAYGAEDTERLKKVAHQTLLSTVLVIMIVQQLVFWFAKPMLRIFNSGQRIYIIWTCYSASR